AEDGIRDRNVTGVQTCALPISGRAGLLAGVACVDLRVAQVDLLAVDLTGDLTGGHGVLGDVLVGAGLQRNDAVQELTTPLDDLRSEERRVGKERRRWVSRWPSR